jgi:hypothetical protein
MMLRPLERGARAAAFVLVALGCSASDDTALPEPRIATPTLDGGIDQGASGGTVGALGTAGRAGANAAGAASGTGAEAGSGAAAGASGSSAGSGNGGTSGAGGGMIDGSAGATGGARGSGPDAGGTCLEQLRAFGVGYMRVEAKGVVDAVELTGPLNGVLIANGTSQNPAQDPMACEFVKTLYAFTTLLKERGFNRIGTLGSYCYRCCCAWSSTNFCRGPDDPEPDCGTSGFSNHSWGRAIDVRYLYKADGTRYDVNDPSHFVQWTGPSETCSAAIAAQTGISHELYGLVCEASARRLFGTALTPNYNEVHRNHFHLDIGQSGPASGFIVRSLGAPNVDISLYGDE